MTAEQILDIKLAIMFDNLFHFVDWGLTVAPKDGLFCGMIVVTAFGRFLVNRKRHRVALSPSGVSAKSEKAKNGRL